MTSSSSDILGLEPGIVRLVDGNAQWPALYAAEARRIGDVIGRQVVAIEHFGSTAIPGIRAKPIIDILVGLRQFDDGRSLVEPLTSLGYDYVGSEMVPDDHLFGLGNPRTGLEMD